MCIFETGAKMLLSGKLRSPDMEKAIIAAIGETLVAEYVDGWVASKEGYDVETKKGKYKGRIEVKTANTPTGNILGVWNLKSKEGNCDWIAIVDLSNYMTDGTYKIFMIPTDKFFTFLRTEDYLFRNNKFYWSKSYNLSDRVRKEPTKFLLEHEIKI